MKDIQKKVDDWVDQYKIGYWNPADNMVHLIEEVGELAREVMHRFGPKKKKDSEGDGDIGEEMADVMFSLICLANSLGIDLDEEFDKVMEKINTRDKDRFEKK